MPKAASARFVSTVIRLETGMRYHALPVPDDVADRFKTLGARRLLATVNGHTFKRALQNHADGGSFIILGRDQLRQCGLRRGATATASLTPDPTPDRLDVPECFALVLEQDDEARARWETFPIGRRRSLLHFVTGVKKEATQIKRAWELAGKIRTRTLYGDRR